MAGPPMEQKIRARRREAAVERMTDHVLAYGLGNASLRALARAAGTSDRMLLYYFASKEEILAETLARVAARLSARLEAAIPAGVPLDPGRLLQQLAAAAAAPELRAHMRVWLELAAAAARGQEPQRAVAGAIADGFLAWIESRLAPGPHRSAEAARVLAMVEGLALLDALGRPDMAARALASRPPDGQERRGEDF